VQSEYANRICPVLLACSLLVGPCASVAAGLIAALGWLCRRPAGCSRPMRWVLGRASACRVGRVTPPSRPAGLLAPAALVERAFESLGRRRRPAARLRALPPDKRAAPQNSHAAPCSKKIKKKKLVCSALCFKNLKVEPRTE